MVLKALEVLHLFWQKQESGQSVREIDLISGKNKTLHGLDSQTWGELRDLLIGHHVITEDRSGHYLLCRDLHTVPFWQLKEWVEKEKPLDGQLADSREPWLVSTCDLLRAERMAQRDKLSANLVELFQP